jgi:hypothetical protein
MRGKITTHPMLIDMVTLFKAKNKDDFVRFQVLTGASMIRYDDGGSTHLETSVDNYITRQYIPEDN